MKKTTDLHKSIIDEEITVHPVGWPSDASIDLIPRRDGWGKVSFEAFVMVSGEAHLIDFEGPPEAVEANLTDAWRRRLHGTDRTWAGDERLQSIRLPEGFVSRLCGAIRMEAA